MRTEFIILERMDMLKPGSCVSTELLYVTWYSHNNDAPSWALLYNKQKSKRPDYLFVVDEAYLRTLNISIIMLDLVLCSVSDYH